MKKIADKSNASQTHQQETPLIQNLKRLMLRQGWRAAPLSLAAGLHASYVRDILRGRARHPSAERLERLARVLGVPLQALTGSGGDGAIRYSQPGETQPAAELLRPPMALGVSDAMFGSRIDADGNLHLSVPRESPLRGEAAQLLSLFAAMPAARRKALLFRLLREQDMDGADLGNASDPARLWAQAMEPGFGR